MRNLLQRLANIGSPAQPVPKNSVSTNEDGPPINAVQHLHIQEAINGKVISFMRYKWNPNGPDDREQVMYVVGPDDSLIDGIATCLTLMEARNAK